MNSSTSLSLCTVNPSIITTNLLQRKSNINYGIGTPWKTHNSSAALTCKASSTPSNSSITDFDLYELLGIDSSSDQSKIKLAYRALQKKCHPDIAGPAGHDMAIVLNEAYSVLSDPNSRFAYDKEQAKVADLRGYTGKPIYSVWLGGESEKRAVFVDEVKCVGCLKCALFADKTFAVESVYGRARVVAQWADPEHKVQAAIESCPVDCISVVERSNLAALEFLMSKQPRGRVRIGTGNTVGARSTNVFDELEKFQARYEASSRKTKEQDVPREQRNSAIQAIKAMSNWLYWKVPGADSSAQVNGDLSPFRHKFGDPHIKRLMDFAAARKQAKQAIHFLPKVSSKQHLSHDEYWDPSNNITVPNSSHINSSGSENVSESTPATTDNVVSEEEISSSNDNNQPSPLLWLVPMAFAAVAGIIVRLQLGEGEAGTGTVVKDHIAGSMIRDIVNSSWLQVILASVTWYLIGMYIVELVVVVKSKLGKDSK